VTAARPAEPRPAATVVLLRPAPDDLPGAEILLTRRPPTMAFAADLDVFPGGRVDPEDGDPRLVDRSLRTPAEAAVVLGGNVRHRDALALHLAAIRELIEETGVLLAREPVGRDRVAGIRDRLLAGSSLADALDDGGPPIRLATDRLAPIAQWTTPAFMSRRFATWFFAADLPPDAELTFEADEVVDHRWTRPIDALDGLADGTTAMWVPTSSVVEQLAALGVASAREVETAIRFGPVAPVAVVSENAFGARVAVSSVGAVPGRRGSVSIVGRAVHVIVDPGDPSEDAVEAILALLERRGRAGAIVLTRTDPDHAAGAEALAIPLRIPILAAPGAGRHLTYDVVEVRDGEELPSDVRVRARPGPAASGRLELELPWNAPGQSAG
jgi:8-oxo-dGTP pyrophosphatase MutT (NUDIX family)